MRSVSLKIADPILEKIDMHLERHHFTTRTEFIRDALREKLEKLEKQRFDEELRTFFRENKQELKQEVAGMSKDVFHELEQRFGR